MGKGWLDFRSGAERERDYHEFSERVFSGGILHRRQVRERLQEILRKKDITYELMYYVALKDLLVRRSSLSFEEGLSQVCSEIHVMRLNSTVKDAIRKVLEEDFAGKFCGGQNDHDEKTQ